MKNGQPGAIFRDRDNKVLNGLDWTYSTDLIQTISLADQPRSWGTWVQRTPGQSSQEANQASRPRD